MQESIMIDHNHPLYLHPSDGPSSLALGIQLIGMENYTLWRQAMKFSLLTRNKLGFVDGSITRDTNGTRFNHLWNRCNAIVKSLLRHNVSRDLLSGVLFRSSARAIWEDLRERFDKFLMGLTDGYSQARSQILMKNKAPSVNQAYAMILQDENQKMVAGSQTIPIESIEPTALFTSRNNT
ncbi:uncharacterized protein LOC142163987 [Nicotiana tabacum]|uniref:Uncharacterized protein LOC142163987 n=1 Tax=Nicotiana tabacum TaxID=4097 RepID=A0AC58RWY9_TOBAC